MLPEAMRRSVRIPVQLACGANRVWVHHNSIGRRGHQAERYGVAQGPLRRRFAGRTESSGADIRSWAGFHAADSEARSRPADKSHPGPGSERAMPIPVLTRPRRAWPAPRCERCRQAVHGSGIARRAILQPPKSFRLKLLTLSRRVPPRNGRALHHPEIGRATESVVAMNAVYEEARHWLRPRYLSTAHGRSRSRCPVEHRRAHHRVCRFIATVARSRCAQPSSTCAVLSSGGSLEMYWSIGRRAPFERCGPVLRVCGRSNRTRSPPEGPGVPDAVRFDEDGTHRA
jgi:hypothetical protein